MVESQNRTGLSISRSCRVYATAYSFLLPPAPQRALFILILIRTYFMLYCQHESVNRRRRALLQGPFKYGRQGDLSEVGSDVAERDVAERDVYECRSICL